MGRPASKAFLAALRKSRSRSRSQTRRAATTFERGEVVEIKGAWHGSPWQAARFSCRNGSTYEAVDNAGVAHYVSSRRIRKRSVK